MASRLGQRLFTQAVRPAARASRNAGRRCMSTTEHGAHKTDSDTPWLIGSAVVFGPAAVWLLSPSSKKSGHDHSSSHHAKPSAPLPTQDSEGTEVPAEKVEKSAKQAEDADAPADAKAAEESQASEPAPITDADGQTASGKEISESVQKATNEDLPPDAQAAEEKQAKEGQFDAGAPGQTEESEDKPDQKEKPQQKPHSGTLQSDEDSGPTNIGDARKEAVQGSKAPKEAKDTISD